MDNFATHENIQEKLKKGEYVDTVTSNKGNIYDITPAANHTIVSVNSLIKGKPNSSVDILNRKGEFARRRWFNENGDQFRDVDFTNHENIKKHPEYPHEHRKRK